VLSAAPDVGLLPGVLLLTLLATFGMCHPLVMAHGRGLVPQALRGRGLGVLNTFVFLGSGLTSSAFGLIADAGQRSGAGAPAAYTGIFLCASALVVLGTAVYWFSPRPAPH
jgi:hypothetical protein